MRTTPAAIARPQAAKSRKLGPKTTTQVSAPIADAAAANAAPKSREELVRETAFALYEARGCEAGHEVEDWLQAETQVDTQAAQLTAH